MQNVPRGLSGRSLPAVIAAAVPVFFIAAQFGPRPLLLFSWSILGLPLAALVVLGIRRHRPTRPLPWQVFAVVVALQSPTTCAFVARDTGRFAPAALNVGVGMLMLLTCVLAPTAYGLLLPRGFWRKQRPAIAFMMIASSAMLVPVAWRVTASMMRGEAITANTALRPLELLWATGVCVAGAFFHALRCVRARRWSEAALSAFPGSVALSYVPLVAGVDQDLGDRLVVIGSSFGFACVAAAALHPTMRAVARGTPQQFGEVSLRPVLTFLAANVVAAPLVVGASRHPWVVPVYASLGGLVLVGWSLRDHDRRLDRRAAGSGGNRALREDLRTALWNQTLTLHYQPIIRLADEAVVGVEALLRWHHPTRGWVSPDVVVPLAQASGLADELADWTLTQAMADGASLLPLLDGERPYIAVNVAPPQLEEPRFVGQMAERLRGAHLGADSVLVEITEQETFIDLQQAATNIRALQAMGVRVAMDDFGAGHANLPLLSHLEIDVVKLDRTVIAGAGRPRGARVLRNMVAMLDDLAVEIVAEGIEDAATGDAVARFGIAIGQGFGLGRPMPVEQLCAALAEPRIDLRIDLRDPAPGEPNAPRNCSHRFLRRAHAVPGSPRHPPPPV